MKRLSEYKSRSELDRICINCFFNKQERLEFTAILCNATVPEHLKRRDSFMKEETSTLVNYRLERAKESLDEAKILVEQGHINTLLTAFIMLVFMLFLLYCLQRDYLLPNMAVFVLSFIRIL